jgi:hypothetical protein
MNKSLKDCKSSRRKECEVQKVLRGVVPPDASEPAYVLHVSLVQKEITT